MRLRHSLPAYLYKAIQIITVEVDNIRVAEYFIHTDLEPEATQWVSATIAECCTQKILYLVVKERPECVTSPLD